MCGVAKCDPNVVMDLRRGSWISEDPKPIPDERLTGHLSHQQTFIQVGWRRARFAFGLRFLPTWLSDMLEQGLKE